MNPLSYPARRRWPPVALLQTFPFLSHSHSRAAAYRRLLTTATAKPRARIFPSAPLSLHLDTSSAAVLPQLGSSLGLDRTRSAIAATPRRFCAAVRQQQQQQQQERAAEPQQQSRQPRSKVNSKSKSFNATSAVGAKDHTSTREDVKRAENEGGTEASGPKDRAKPGEGAVAKDKKKGTDGEPEVTKKQDEADEAEGKNKQDGPDEADGKNKQDGPDEADGKKRKDESKEDPAPPPPHGDKTPWQVFMETMSTEFEKSKEWNDTTKAIASSAHQFTESDSVRRAREAYDKTSGAASSALRTTAGAIGKGAVWTWDTPVVKGVRKAANVTGEAVEKATRPIRETEAFKNVKNVIDDGSSSRYGGWVEKEERRKRREEDQVRIGGGSGGGVGADGRPTEELKEDPNAGTNVTVHKDAQWKEAWRDFRDTNKVMQGFFSMGQAYQESENPLVSTARSITDRIAGWFAENETALVIRKIRSMDPAFQLEPFLRDLREYILPEVLDAYVRGDVETLKLWLSAAQFSVYEALTQQYATAGLRSDGRILDIRAVDILKARLLDPGDVPVFIITCRTQEVHVYRHAKTGELAAGMEDRVQLVTYAIGITRVPEDVNNPETRGWRLIEMQKSGREWY